MAWRPVDCDSIHGLGFATGDLDARFREACDRLGLLPVSEIEKGYWGKALGSVVETPDGQRYWLKVFGVEQIDNANRLTEIRADEIVGAYKPALVRQHDWSDGKIHYTARMTALASSSVERNPWAGMTAAQLPDSWIHDLVSALNSLSGHASTGTYVKQRTLEDWLFARHRIRYEFPQGDWRLSHNDLNWSNVTAPTLSILDWEWHGYAPVGYDPGRLIAFACRHENLVHRLERAFAPSFASFTGLVARAFATDRVMDGVRSGAFDPDLEPALAHMSDRLDSEVHTKCP